MDTPVIFIYPEKAKGIKAKQHPWIFDGAIVHEPNEVSNGELVEVSSKNIGTIGFGLFCKYSKIRVRMVSYGPDRLPDTWLSDRIRRTFEIKKRLPIGSNAFRLVNGEGDYIPGLVVDGYNTSIVVRPLVRFMELRMDEIVSAIGGLFPDHAVYLKRDEHACRNERLELTNGYLRGESRGSVIIGENGIRFAVDIKNGQKTGFYLDQRENRRLLALFCADRTVCDLFCYTGAFSIAAANGGAKSILSVDGSQGALDIARENATLNGNADPSKYEWLCGDVFNAIEKIGTYDIMILDPPPFARRKAELEGALTGYKYLNEKAIRACSKNGLLFTFSCSGAVSPVAFKETVRDAALRAGRIVRTIRELHADMDHTVSLVHPEGEYLKGLILHVE